MVDVDKAVVAKLKKGENHFEILVDCEKALEFRKGKDVNLDDVLATNDIFKDVKRGEHASDLMKFFGTEDKREIAKKIIKEGDVQLTSEYKSKLREEKKRRIISLITRGCINPDTNTPHPPQRIETAMNDSKVKIDEFKSAEEQVNAIIDKIRIVLPIKYEVREIAIRIPSAHAGKCYSVFKQYGKVMKEEWQNDGSLVTVVEVPAGIQEELFDKLNSIAHGEVESKILNVKG